MVKGSASKPGETTDQELLARIEADLDNIKAGPFSAAPLRALRAAAAKRDAAETQVTNAVAAAKHAGVSWAGIGAALGVSRQAAAKRYSQTI